MPSEQNIRSICTDPSVLLSYDHLDEMMRILQIIKTDNRLPTLEVVIPTSLYDDLIYIIENRNSSPPPSIVEICATWLSIQNDQDAIEYARSLSRSDEFVNLFRRFVNEFAPRRATELVEDTEKVGQESFFKKIFVEKLGGLAKPFSKCQQYRRSLNQR